LREITCFLRSCHNLSIRALYGLPYLVLWIKKKLITAFILVWEQQSNYKFKILEIFERFL